MLTLSIAFAAAFLSTYIIVRSGNVHAHRSGDHDFCKPQGFHTVAVPRIGGLGIVIGLLAAGGSVWLSNDQDSSRTLFWLMVSAGPVFLAGFVQDFTEAITPRGRLIAAGGSACLAFAMLDAAIRVTDIPGLDWLVSFGFGALLVTVFTVTGVANSVNIIDGFNGLASMCVMLMLGAVAVVAWKVDDSLIGLLSLAGIGAIFGFFVWNFPSGQIFLGDGGSYFLGFLLSELCILLLGRNPDLSPLFPLLVCVYPVFETLFSIYRRMVLRKRPPHMPDGIHLHSLIYRRVMRFPGSKADTKQVTRRNSLTAPYLWLLCVASIVPAVLFSSSTPVMAAFLLLFGATYVWLYRRIVRFRTPKWLVVNR